MKKIFIFSILVLIFSVTAVSAQEPAANAFFPWELDFTANDSDPDIRTYATGYSRFPIIGKLGIGIINVFFGLGSYVSGEWGDGLFLTLFQGGGIAFAILGLHLYINNHLVFGEGRFWRGVGGVFLLCTGVSCYGVGLINSFLFPFGVGYGGNKSFFNPPSVNRINNQRRNDERELRRQNWDINMAFLPLPNGPIGQIIVSMSY